MKLSTVPISEDELKPPFPNPGKIFAGKIYKCMLYIFAATVLQMSNGLGSNMILTNINDVAKYFHTTNIAAIWLVAAYMAPNVSLAIFLIKIRNQFGLRAFAELSIIAFLIVCLLHLFVTDIRIAIIIRFFAGVTAAPMTSLALLYMIEAFAPAKKMTIGLSLYMMNLALFVPLAYYISPSLTAHQGFLSLYTLEMALALMAFACIFSLPLKPIIRAKVIEKIDFLSYGLIAFGLGLNAIIMTVGKYYWWQEKAWIGVCLAIAIGLLTLALIIELRRKNPLIDVRWLFSKEMLYTVIALCLFRILLSEQSSLANNFFHLFGLTNADISPMYLSVIFGTILGGFSCVFFYKQGREDIFHIIALIVLGLGAYLDSHVNAHTTPNDMRLSQALIGFGYALFLPPTLSRAFANAISRGPKYVLSFIAVFLVSQSTGGLMASAFFGSIQMIRANYYHNILSWQYQDTGENIQTISHTIAIKANILAYSDTFKLYAILAFIALFGVFLKMIMIKLYKYEFTFIKWKIK